MSARFLLLIGLLIAVCPLRGRAQVPFFNYGPAIAYQPVVNTILTGTSLAVRPTVSADRKYVTISGNFTQSGLLRLETFPVVVGAIGNVGGAIPAPPVRGVRPQDINASFPVSVHPPGGGSILNRPGMTRIE